MSRDPQRLPDYLGHILEAIERIQAYVADVDEVGFLASKIIQDAVIRNLEVIGEASRNIERVHPEFAAAHPELPLALANDMRNALAHAGKTQRRMVSAAIGTVFVQESPKHPYEALMEISLFAMQ